MKISGFLLWATIAYLAAFPTVCIADDGNLRYQPSGVSMRLWEDESGGVKQFQDYLQTTSDAIETFHWKSDGESSDEHRSRARLVAPREWRVNQDCDPQDTEGVLLIHGLSDSPFLMSDLGDALSEMSNDCFLIRSILLPGHASTPGDLRIVNWRDWVQAVRYGIESFQGEASSVHVVGFSTGGALAVYWALNSKSGHLSVPIKSLVLLSPAIRISGLPNLPRFLFSWVATLSEWTGLMAWTEEAQDIDYAKYESFPLNAGYQLYLLDLAIEVDMHQMDIPIYMALSREDATVDPLASIKLFQRFNHPNSQLLVVAKDADEPTVKGLSDDRRVEVREGRIPLQRITSFSHNAFPVKPGNAHYGRYGDYANCLHYTSHDKRCECKTEQMRLDHCGPARVVPEPSYGEKAKGLDEQNGVMRRLTFNPYFDDMLTDIKKFIAINGSRGKSPASDH